VSSVRSVRSLAEYGEAHGVGVARQDHVAMEKQVGFFVKRMVWRPSRLMVFDSRMAESVA
jgi:hypothetical protein